MKDTAWNSYLNAELHSCFFCISKDQRIQWFLGSRKSLLFDLDNRSHLDYGRGYTQVQLPPMGKGLSMVNKQKPLHQTQGVPTDPHSADWWAIEVMVQCYWREIAEPNGLVTWLDCAPQWCDQSHEIVRTHVARIDLPFSTRSLTVSVDRRSTVGIRHLGQVLLTDPAQGSGTRDLSRAELARLIVEELARRYGRPVNEDLLIQMRLSAQVMDLIVQARAIQITNPWTPATAYIQSEQSLVYGHPFHPTPKARSGLSREDLTRYSPELGASFPLHYFAVRKDLVIQDSCLEVTTPEMVESEGPKGLLADDSWTLIPVHPWQAEYLRGLHGVQNAETTGSLRYLGPHGRDFRPTASVRTLYASDSRYFYKMSLSFRITNCLRRNALPELAAALRVNRIMTQLRPEMARYFPTFHFLDELGYMTVRLQDAPSEEQNAITEGFGVMLRRRLEHSSTDEIPLLAAALFGNGDHGRAVIRWLLTSAYQSPEPADDSILAWFKAYLEQIIPPLLYLYGRVGVMFEPHLQNVVIGFRHGLPVAAYLRDFENARLVDERVNSALTECLTDDEKKELFYGEEKAWKRFAYCLFGNHVVEAVRQLTYGRPDLESSLWTTLRKCLETYLRDYGENDMAPKIRGLLNGESFVAKTNLLTRVLAGKDAEATYAAIGNPWVNDLVGLGGRRTLGLDLYSDVHGDHI
jgi:siderophore synthetase component